MYTETIILVHTNKEPINMGRNSFFRELELGASEKGYWTYERMGLKIEDCVDVLKDLHPGIYFIFIFYHSVGYDRGK